MPPPAKPLTNGILVSPGACHPLLDPVVQSFLDRGAEAACVSPAPIMPPMPAMATADRGFDLLRPARFAAGPLPILVYLHVAGPVSRHDALLALADSSGVAVLLHPITAAAPQEMRERSILDALDAVAAQSVELDIDPARIALGGDGLGALAAVSFASSSRAPAYRPAVLVLTTPILGHPALDGPAAGLTASAADELAAAGIAMTGKHGWPTAYPFERLRKLPPTVIVTAQADPFRDAAEAFARRLMAAEVDVCASRMLGTIHDFAWLPDLVQARSTLAAHCMVAGMLREHLALT